MGSVLRKVAQGGGPVRGLPPQSGHFLEIPFADGLFDRVVSSFAFHHLMPGEYRRAFTEVLRVMVPGGRFVIADIMFASDEERQAARDRMQKASVKVGQGRRP